MKSKTGLPLLILLILTHSSFAQRSDHLAPKTTNAEAQLSFGDIPYLEKAFINAKPTDRKDGILIGELGVDGGDKAMILKLAQDITDNKYGNFDSFLIAHKGKLLFESYYRRGRVNLPHPQASATKSYTSLALGRAIQLGYLSLDDLHKPLASFLKDLDPGKFVDGAEKITLHQALTMRTGIHLTTEQREEIEKDPTQIKGQKHLQAFLEHSKPITETSQTFAYKDDPRLVMQVIEAVVPGSAKDFIKRELLDKMGITNYSWLTDVSGLPRSGNGTSMTSRDMLKWGILAANKGKWNGEQLVPEAFVVKSTSKIVDQSEEYDDTANSVSGTAYGYFFWQADLSAGGKSYLSKSARGGSGQNITVIDELDLVIVTTTHRPVDNIVSFTATRVLPPFIQHATPTKNEGNDVQDEYPILTGPYIGQKPPGLIPEVFAPGIVSKEHRDWTGRFTPDMKEYYFTRLNSQEGKNTKIVFKSENNRWHETVLDPRMGGSISPDGKKMHSGNTYRERTENGWSELKSLGSPFEDIPIMVLTASTNGTYVFDERTEGGTIRYSRLIDGKREAPKAFGKEINSGKWTAHPFIAPDESYIIWDSEREDGYGDNDLYISFRQPDGSWSDAINLGDKINTEGPDTGGVVSPDGKYFFFNRKISPEDSDVFWVDTQVFETLRPKE